MGFDRAHRDVQLRGDLGVGMPERDQAQNVDLALRQVVRRPWRRLCRQARPESRVQVALAGRREPHRLDQLAVGGLLEDVGGRAGRHRLTRVGGLLLHRQHHDSRGREFAADRRDRLEARAPRHVEVEHKHVRLMAADVAPRLLDVTGLGDHLEVRLFVEQQAEPAAHHRMIVSEHDPDRLAGGVCARVVRVGHAANATCQ